MNRTTIEYLVTGFSTDGEERVRRMVTAQSHDEAKRIARRFGAHRYHIDPVTAYLYRDAILTSDCVWCGPMPYAHAQNLAGRNGFARTIYDSAALTSDQRDRARKI